MANQRYGTTMFSGLFNLNLRLRVLFKSAKMNVTGKKVKTTFPFILTLPWETRDFGSAEMDVLLYEATIPRLTIFPLGKSRSHTHESKGFRKFDPHG